MKYKNHYIPKFYLERWSDNGEIETHRLLVADIRYPYWVRPYISSECRRNYLYTTHEQADEMELLFDKKYEDPTAPIIDKIIRQKKLKPTEWHALAEFVALQDFRTLKSLQNHLSNESMRFQRVVTELTKKIEQNPDHFFFNEESGQCNSENTIQMPLKISISHDKEAGKLNINHEYLIGRKSWLAGIQDLLFGVAPLLKNHNWTVVRPSSGFQWPTSDNPVIKCRFKSNGSFQLVEGLGEPGAYVFLPLSPKILLFTQVGVSSRDLPRKYSKLGGIITEKIIEVIVANAHRSVYSAQRDSNIVKLSNRVVDKNRLETEENALKNWDEINTSTELDFNS